MCCRTGPGRRRHQQPLVFTLGRFVYNRYQERKQQQQQQQQQKQEQQGEPFDAANSQRRSSPPPHILEHAANDEILVKIGMRGPPPSYDAAVNEDDDDEKDYRLMKQSTEHGEDRDDLSDVESFFEDDGVAGRQENAVMSAAREEFVRNWAANRDGEGCGGVAARPGWTERRWRKAVREADRAAMGM